MIPFGKRIYFQPDSKKSVIETKDKNLVETGTVIAIGDDVKKIKVGDKMIFTSWGVDVITIGDIEHHFVLEDDRFILGTMPE